MNEMLLREIKKHNSNKIFAAIYTLNDKNSKAYFCQIVKQSSSPTIKQFSSSIKEVIHVLVGVSIYFVFWMCDRKNG